MQDYKKRTEEFEQKVKKMIKELANIKFDGELDNHYNTFALSCKKLTEKMKSLYQLDENENYPKMTLAQRDEFLTYYANVIESANQIRFIGIEKNESIVKPLKEVAQYISDNATKDIKALIKMDEEKNLPSIIEDARAKTIDITGTNVEIVGNSLSKRMVIENNGKKAVFTPDSYFNMNKELEEYRNKFIKTYPEFQELSKRLCNHPDFIYCAKEYANLKVTVDGKVDISFENIEEKCPQIAKLIEINQWEKFYDDMLKKPGFSEYFYNLCVETRKLDLSIGYSVKYQKLKKNEPVAERNSGMSIVAELLGCKNIIAHSEPAYVEKDGKTMRGTLMDFADGVDFKTIKSDNPILKQKISCFDTKDAKKQMADLQIIDYICGNLDRHGQNMFYKFNDKNECIGIIGIDNDGSFGMTNDEENKIGKVGMQGYANLGIITQSMAERIKIITPEMLSIALKGTKISEDALDCALTRFTILRNMVLNKELSPEFDGEKFEVNDIDVGPLSASINVIPDEKWDNIPFEMLADAKTFGNNKKTNVFIAASKELINAKYRRNSVFNEFRDSSSASFDYMTSIKSASFELVNQEKSLDSGIKFYRGSSKQYNDIKKDIKEIAKAQKKLPDKPTVEELADFKKLLNKAIIDSQAYLDRKKREEYNPETKKGEKYGSYTQNRIKIMNDYHNYLVEKVATIDSKYEEMVKKDNEFNEKAKKIKERNEKRKSLEENQKLLNKIENDVKVKDEIIINDNSDKNIEKVLNKNNEAKIDKQNDELGNGKN